MQATSSIVAVVKGERGHAPVFKALDVIDYKKALVGYDKVLTKINFIVEKALDTGATTDPRALLFVHLYSNKYGKMGLCYLYSKGELLILGVFMMGRGFFNYLLV